jgi:antitoxin MazE
MQITRIGDGLAILLTPELIERLGLKEGDEVQVLPVAKPPARSQADIDAAFELIRQLRGLVPADYKFKRSDAYEDGEY